MLAASLPRSLRDRLALALALAPVLLALPLALSAATLTMPNGETLRGTVISATAQTIVFQSDSFGRLTIARSPSVVLDPSDAPPVPAPSAATAPPAPEARPEPPPALIQQMLGFSDKWSAEIQFGMSITNGQVNLRAYQTEATIGYKTPPHQYGLFASYQHQRVNGHVVDEATEIIGRYFYMPEKSRWLLVSQAGWMRDVPNLTDTRTDLVAVPAYRLLEREHQRFVLGLGPSYRSETRLVPTDDTLVPTDHDSFRVAFYQVFNWDIHPHLTLRETLLAQVDPSQTDNIGLRLDLTLSQALTEHLMLNLEYSYILDENPLFEDQSIGTLNLMGGYSF